MSEEFCLSDKELQDENHWGRLVPDGKFDIDDVKEFIRLLKEHIKQEREHEIHYEWDYNDLKKISELIDKLAGDKLI